MQGRRTALPRHRTLGATLDWSYSLLPEFERLVLRRLAVFAGTFTMESASAILASDETSSTEVVDAIADLVAKSLVSAGVDGPIALLSPPRHDPRLRARQSSRRAANTAGSRSGTPSTTGALLEQAQADWESRPATEWRERYRHLIDNVRAALDWSFSPAGEAATGVALAVATVPLWFALVADQRMRRAHRPRAGEPARKPQRGPRYAPLCRACLVSHADERVRRRNRGRLDSRARHL